MKNFGYIFLVIFWGINLQVAATDTQSIDVSFEEDNGLPLVFLNVVVQRGATFDPKGQSGITRFAGKMLMRGTKLRSKKQIDVTLDRLGASLGIDVRSEMLVLRGSVLSKNLPQFLKLLNEMITQPSFPKKEIRKLKSETISGILNSLTNDRRLARQRFEEELFSGHPYSQAVAGKRKDIKRLSRAQIMHHFETLFQARNIFIAGTGDAKREQIEKWANELAKQRPGGSGSIRIPLPSEPKRKRLVIINKPERTQTQIFIGHLGPTMGEPDYFPLYLGIYAFGGSFKGRMMKELRIKRGWTYGAYSVFRHASQRRTWYSTYFPAVKDTPAALELGLKMIADLKSKGITEEEYNFAKNSLVNNAGFRYNTPSKRVENTVTRRVLGLPEGYFKNFGQRISRLSRKDVNKKLAQFIKTDRLLVGVLATASELKPKLMSAAGVTEKDTFTIQYDRD